MIKFKRLTIALVALFTLTTGAWAQSSEPATDPNEITVTPVTGQQNQWTFTMPASNVLLTPIYAPEFTATFVAGNANTIQGGKATVTVKEKDGTTAYTGATLDENGNYKPLYEGQTITMTAAAGYKFKSVEVKKGGAVENAYLKWDADQKKLVATAMPTTATKVESADAGVNWSAGTYVVEEEVTINGSITLNGNVDLIIKDGATLTANMINGDNKNLSIYGQANQSGELVVNCTATYSDAISTITTLEVHSAKVTATASGFNRGGFYDIGTFNVYGGLVDAKNTGSKGFGISLKAGGSMNIYGGEVKAEGKGEDNLYGYGILCENSNNKATVTVFGGKLWAGNADKIAFNFVTLQKGAGFTGKIYTSDNGSSWAEYTEAATPTTKYVRVGY
jgi:hypothetical protein